MRATVKVFTLSLKMPTTDCRNDNYLWVAEAKPAVKERFGRHFLKIRLWKRAEASAIMAFGLFASSEAVDISTSFTNLSSTKRP